MYTYWRICTWLDKMHRRSTLTGIKNIPGNYLNLTWLNYHLVFDYLQVLQFYVFRNILGFSSKSFSKQCVHRECLLRLWIQYTRPRWWTCWRRWADQRPLWAGTTPTPALVAGCPVWISIRRRVSKLCRRGLLLLLLTLSRVSKVRRSCDRDRGRRPKIIRLLTKLHYISYGRMFIF